MRMPRFRHAVAIAAVLPAVTNVTSCEPPICEMFGEQVQAEGCGESAQRNRPPIVGPIQLHSLALVDEELQFSAAGQDQWGKFLSDVDELNFEWDFDGDGRVDLEEYGSSEFDRGPEETGLNLPTAWHRGSVARWKYRRPGIYNLRLRVTDFPVLLGAPEEVVVTRRVRVFTQDQYDDNRAPSAAFDVLGEPVVVGGEVRVDAAPSSDPDRDALTYEWEVEGEPQMAGDGASSDPLESRVLGLTYAEEGCYRIALVVRDDFGTASRAEARRLCVFGPDRRPVADLRADPNPTPVGRAVTFSGHFSRWDPTVDGRIVSYEWDLDGVPGYEQSGTRDSAIHSYQAPGRVGARLRVTDARGFSDVAELDVYAGRTPQPRLTIEPSHARPSQPVVFSAAESSDADGDIVKYEWDYDGDGRFDVETPTPSTRQALSVPGVYDARVRVTDSIGLQDVAQARLLVEQAAGGPTAALTVDPNPAFAGESVTFSAAGSTDPNDDIVSYEWDLDGVGEFERQTTVSSTSFTYDQPRGDVVVRVRVVDATGESSIAARSLRVLEAPPESAPRVGAAGAGARPRRVAARRPFTADLGATRAGRLPPGGLVSGLGRVRIQLAAPPRLTRAERQLRRFLGSRWRTQLKFAARPAQGRATVSGFVLASPSGGRRSPQVCARVKVDLMAGQLPRGTLTVVGGTGSAARLRASATFRFRLRQSGPARIVGTMRTGTGRARGLPRGCRRIAAR